jgi:flagella basal body P-ring formation protein FlgA
MSLVTASILQAIVKRTFRAAVLAGTLAGTLHAAGGEALVVSFRERAVIDGRRVLLAQIADLLPARGSGMETLGGLDLGKSPRPGLVRYFGKYEVIRALRRKNIDTRKVAFEGAPRTCVSRPVSVLSESELESRAVRYCRSELGMDPEKVHIALESRPGEMVFPEGNLECRFRKRSGGTPGEPLMLETEIYSQNRQVRSLLLRFSTRVVSRVCVAARDLEPGAVLGEDDYRVVKKNLRSRESARLAAPGDVSGYSPVRRIPKGRLIRSNVLEKPVVIHRGQPVNLEIRKGRLCISMRGEAMDDGSHGERIRVRNRSKRQVITGTVWDGQTVIAG